jgi:hypothetical protein
MVTVRFGGLLYYSVYKGLHNTRSYNKLLICITCTSAQLLCLFESLDNIVRYELCNTS